VEEDDDERRTTGPEERESLADPSPVLRHTRIESEKVIKKDPVALLVRLGGGLDGWLVHDAPHCATIGIRRGPTNVTSGSRRVIT
jgi:hypothetical protein